MVHERVLSTVLSEFARTLVTGFPIQAILDHLVGQVVEVLPVTSSGVTLIGDEHAPHYLAVSDEAALRLEQLQSELGQGPCLRAYSTGEPVTVPDLAVDTVFPVFAPAARALGCAAVFTFPLRHADGCLGALDLYRDTPGELTEQDVAAAQTLADVTTAYLLNARAREAADNAAIARTRTGAGVEAGESIAATDDGHTSMRDAVTGLPNRRLLDERLTHAAQRALRGTSEPRNAVVVFCDPDRFQQLSDVFGPQTGDELLAAVAHRLSGLIGPGDTLARVRGGEFVFLLEDLRGVIDVHQVAGRVSAAFTAPFVLGGFTLSMTARVVSSLAGPDEQLTGELTENVIVRGDAEMVEPERRGGGPHPVVELRAGVRTHDRAALEQDLRHALSRDELTLAYQPIVSTGDGVVTGVEALLRWTHPRRGPVPVATVTEIAEQNGFIGDIGSWVLEQACTDLARWCTEHPGALVDVAVNVSTAQLVHPDFPHRLEQVLHRTGADPAQVILEMTASVIINDERVATALDCITDLGVRLAVDDFGTGYASLTCLRRLPVDIVKMDRGFIADLDNPRGGAVAAAVTALAHTLGLIVIAEGVETPDQHRQVRTVGCDLAQGDLYARPLTASLISTELEKAARKPGGSRWVTRRPSGVDGSAA